MAGNAFKSGWNSLQIRHPKWIHHQSRRLVDHQFESGNFNDPMEDNIVIVAVLAMSHEIFNSLWVSFRVSWR